MTCRRTAVAHTLAALAVVYVSGLYAQIAATPVENTPAPSPAGKTLRWEYKVLNEQGVHNQDPHGGFSLPAGLDALGSEGWELVSVTPGIPSPKSLAEFDRTDLPSVRWAVPPLYYFKRPLK